MSRNYVAFDIETAADVPGPDFNWQAARPLGITCAATALSDSRKPTIWHGKNADGSPAKQMTQAEAQQLVDFLKGKVADGYTLLTWNGVGFDLDVLAEEADDLETCRSLAVDQIDMMFHVFCDRGYPVALEKAAEALRIRGKPTGMSGLLAPQLWAKGEFEQVLAYVGEDVRIALEVAERCEEKRTFKWKTQRGTTSTMPLPRGWLKVRDALRLPLPDTSWMSDPIPRERFMAWLTT